MTATRPTPAAIHGQTGALERPRRRLIVSSVVLLTCFIEGRSGSSIADRFGTFLRSSSMVDRSRSGSTMAVMDCILLRWITIVGPRRVRATTHPEQAVAAVCRPTDLRRSVTPLHDCASPLPAGGRVRLRARHPNGRTVDACGAAADAVSLADWRPPDAIRAERHLSRYRRPGRGTA